MSRWLSSSLALAIVLWPLRAQANPSARLVYVRGPGANACPDESAVRAAVTARLGYDPFFLSAPTTIFVEVVRTGERFAAQVKLIDSQGVELGTRRLATATGHCVDLIGTLALTISLVVDPVSLALPPTAPAANMQDAPAVSVTMPAQAPAAIAMTVPVAREVPSTAPQTPTFFAGLALLGSLGSALAPTGGAAALVGVRDAWGSIHVEGRGDLPTSASDPPASAWALVGLAVPCAHWRAAFACAAVGFESIRASGEGTGARHAETAVALVGGRVGAELALTTHLALAPFAEALVPVQRPRIEAEGVPVHTFSPVAGDVGIAGVVRFR